MVLKSRYKEIIEEDIYNCDICNGTRFPNCSQCKNLSKIVQSNEICQPCLILDAYKTMKSKQNSNQLFYPHEYTYIGEKYEFAKPRILFLAEIGNMDRDGTLKLWYEQKEVVPNWKFDVFNESMTKDLPTFPHFQNEYGMQDILEELDSGFGMEDICHSNLAKCANLHRRQDKKEIAQMIKMCWETHLMNELPILRPDIIIVFRTQFVKEFKKYGIKQKFLEIDSEFSSQFNLTEAQIRQNDDLVKFFVWKFLDDDSPRLIIHFNHPANRTETNYNNSKFSFDKRIQIIKDFLFR